LFALFYAERGFKSDTVANPSFIPQGIDRISDSNFGGLETDRQQGNDQCNKPGEEKDQQSDITPVGKTLEPAVHDVIGDWPGD